MPSHISVATPERTSELLGFLRRVFQAGEDSPMLHPDLMRWKCFDPHPWWAGGRSYVFDRDGAIAAHGCITPVRFAAPDGLIDSMQVIDWAADPLVAGGGMLIYYHCLKQAGTLLTIGGSADARRAISAVKWFRRLGDMQLYARPLRPFRYSANGVDQGLKARLKTVRRLAWSLWPALPAAAGWRCLPVPQLERVWTPSGAFIPIHRTPEWLNYYLQCPAARFEALALQRHGEIRGHALAVHTGPQLRVVDFAIDSTEEREWISALSALLRWAGSQPGACEFCGGSSLAFMQRVYAGVGMRLRDAIPVHLADPAKHIPQDAEVEINLLIGDASYLTSPQFPFWC